MCHCSTHFMETDKLKIECQVNYEIPLIHYQTMEAVQGPELLVFIQSCKSYRLRNLVHFRFMVIIKVELHMWTILDVT